MRKLSETEKEYAKLLKQQAGAGSLRVARIDSDLIDLAVEFLTELFNEKGPIQSIRWIVLSEARAKTEYQRIYTHMLEIIGQWSEMGK